MKATHGDTKHNFLRLQMVRCHRELKLEKSIPNFSNDSWQKPGICTVSLELEDLWLSFMAVVVILLTTCSPGCSRSDDPRTASDDDIFTAVGAGNMLDYYHKLRDADFASYTHDLNADRAMIIMSGKTVSQYQRDREQATRQSNTQRELDAAKAKADQPKLDAAAAQENAAADRQRQIAANITTKMNDYDEKDTADRLAAKSALKTKYEAADKAAQDEIDQATTGFNKFYGGTTAEDHDKLIDAQKRRDAAENKQVKLAQDYKSDQEKVDADFDAKRTAYKKTLDLASEN